MEIRTVKDEDVPQLLTLYRHLNPDDTDTDLADAKTNLDLLNAIHAAISSSAA